MAEMVAYLATAVLVAMAETGAKESTALPVARVVKVALDLAVVCMLVEVKSLSPILRSTMARQPAVVVDMPVMGVVPTVVDVARLAAMAGSAARVDMANRDNSKLATARTGVAERLRATTAQEVTVVPGETQETEEMVVWEAAAVSIWQPAQFNCYQ